MLELDRIAGTRIEEAIGRGELDDLPGMGAPLALDDDRMVPEPLRIAHRILKNAGYVPEAVSMRAEIASLETAIAAGEIVHDDRDVARGEDGGGGQCRVSHDGALAARRLALLRARLGAQGRSDATLVSDRAVAVGSCYQTKLSAALGRPRS